MFMKKTLVPFVKPFVLFVFKNFLAYFRPRNS